jgi:hypothetical protein
MEERAAHFLGSVSRLDKVCVATDNACARILAWRLALVRAITSSFSFVAIEARWFPSINEMKLRGTWL